MELIYIYCRNRKNSILTLVCKHILLLLCMHTIMFPIGIPVLFVALISLATMDSCIYIIYIYIYILQCVNELTGKPKWVTNMALCIPQNKILLTTG